MLKLIRPEGISTYFIDEITHDKKAHRIIHAVRIRDIESIAVEKLTNGESVLVAGFSTFAAYLRLYPSLYIPVVELALTNERERIIRILTTAITLEKDTTWHFKNFHIMRLINEHGMNIEQIARATNQKRETIRRYILDGRIPTHILEVMDIQRAKSVVESICTSRVLTVLLKIILYEKAVLPVGDPLRCDGRKYRLIIEFFSTVIHRIPLSILNDEMLLEQLVDTLIYNNFRLSEHWNELLNQYLESVLIKN
ncbi:hypothetical protein [Sutcliffiella halmapala]|uniref:hypothetical protein n=1 Tax=Sutcliffiella halmapala TaxID=79882 RepID=UPI000994E430|nr:hypothetical protein [Sutcliffiella halmapala]